MQRGLRLRVLLTAALLALPFALAAEPLPPGLVVKKDSVGKAEIEQAKMYAVVLGKAQGCGLDVRKELDAVGGWIDRNYIGEGHAALVNIVMKTVPLQAELQKSDRAFDACDKVRARTQRVTWPM